MVIEMSQYDIEEIVVNDTCDKKTVPHTLITINSTDDTGKIVKSVWLKSITKMNREKWDMVWQYYRHRTKLPVMDVLRKYKGKELRIVYSGKLNGAINVSSNKEDIEQPQQLSASN
jgi:hypothetical protein